MTTSSGKVDDHVNVLLSFGAMVTVPPPDPGSEYAPAIAPGVTFCANGIAGESCEHSMLASTTVGATEAEFTTFVETAMTIVEPSNNPTTPRTFDLPPMRVTLPGEFHFSAPIRARTHQPTASVLGAPSVNKLRAP